MVSTYKRRSANGRTTTVKSHSRRRRKRTLRISATVRCRKCGKRRAAFWPFGHVCVIRKKVRRPGTTTGARAPRDRVARTPVRGTGGKKG